MKTATEQSNNYFSSNLEIDQAFGPTSRTLPDSQISYNFGTISDLMPTRLPDWRIANAPEPNEPSMRQSRELSIHSKSDLKPQLPSKTNSFINDVWSALAGLTIEDPAPSLMSRAGRVRSSFSDSIFGTGPSIRALYDIHENEDSSPFPGPSQPRLYLPGEVAANIVCNTYCIGEKCYRRKPWSKDVHSDMATVINYQDLEVGGNHRKDAFGDTILHVVAPLEKAPWLLTRLLSYGIEVHAEHSANETFLHLMGNVIGDPEDWSVPGWSLLNLLGKLKRIGYDFTLLAGTA